jgi:Rps23 Pro-64 3,4-dihydroxylase Tpa1-like proline 4-hydroxylase
MFPILDMFNDKKFAKIAQDNNVSYNSAKPWEHIALDNFLPTELARQISEAFPKPIDLQGNHKIEPWKYHKNQNVDRWLLEDSTEMPEALKLFTYAVNSRSFLLFLETLTGIDSLLPDPYFLGGGAMVTGSGGFLNVHADFNWNANQQSWRRVNALFYLTPNWQKEWGGNLELWSKDGKDKVKEIAPEFNRVVIFSTKSDTYHGQPVPTKTPTGVTRNLFSAFYYTSKSTEGIDNDPHFTKYSKDASPYSKQIKNDYLNK